MPSAPRVFISYFSQDFGAAEQICRVLEGNDIPCWIAPRNVLPGASYAASIVEAIEQAKVVVFVWSRRTEVSGHVKIELERATSAQVAIIPFRIDDVQPTRDIAYFVGSRQWLNAFEAPLAQHFEKLVYAVRMHLQASPEQPAGSVRLPNYLVTRLDAHRDYLHRPRTDPAEPNAGAIRIEDLRERLLQDDPQLEQPEPVRVTGTLFPCALLSSGWWEKRKADKKLVIDWRDGLQEWLFHGFDLWGPSWDVSGDFKAWSQAPEQRYFIAQLGDGDEANSIPVLIPSSKAPSLQDELARRRWGGMEAEIGCFLGHRKHFSDHIDPEALEVFGGLLDFCLWLGNDHKDHYIDPLGHKTQLYSGYLWKCVAPKSVLQRAPSISDVYFIWEHANFSSQDALSYALDAMTFKEEQVRKRCGEDLALVHKSSNLVPGEPTFSADAIYRMLVGKAGTRI
jgi:TIR domain-containing protein